MPVAAASDLRTVTWPARGPRASTRRRALLARSRRGCRGYERSRGRRSRGVATEPEDLVDPAADEEDLLSAPHVRKRTGPVADRLVQSPRRCCRQVGQLVRLHSRGWGLGPTMAGDGLAFVTRRLRGGQSR